jgi:hypothetical protein
MTRQQRRFEARKGVRSVGFTYVPSWREAAPLPAPAKRSWAIKPSKSDEPAYRKSIWPAEKIARVSA